VLALADLASAPEGDVCVLESPAADMTVTNGEPRLRALIVDDEYAAREELRHLLKSFPEIEVIGDTAAQDEALELLRNINYDLCFIDIIMPGGSGLNLVKELPRISHRPAVIFVTAYPDYAVEAFDLEAVDYLLKPFDEVRLERALQRVIDRGSEGAMREHAEIGSAPTPASEHAFDKIPVPLRDRTILIDVEDVAYAAAARGYSYLVTLRRRYLVPYSLAELERRFSGRGFFRAHRAYLINLRKAHALEPDFAGALHVVMEGDIGRVPLSRRRARSFRKLLGC
jgi:DNA-binding LytR/AlgR family response regulator